MANCKFKVGDKVVGNHATRYTYTKKGWKGVVTEVNANGTFDARGDGNPDWNLHFCGLEPKYFDLVLTNHDKIVITHDGKVTTATLYGVMGKVTATARCAPEDTFDFNFGAKLAMERLMEKVEPVVEPKDEPITVGGFKIGDRVNYDGVNGTVICFMKDEYASIGVEFDKPLKKLACHNCGGFPLMAGKEGTKGTSRWMLVENLTAGEVPEPPKYYNGKVVCVKKGYENSIPLPDFTIGKVYDVVDGNITDDADWVGGTYETLEKLCVSMGWTFIPLVE